MNKRLNPLTFLVVLLPVEIFILTILLVYFQNRTLEVQAQAEQPFSKHQTKFWTIDSGDDKIFVFDTTGACLYVTYHNPQGIAVLSKKDLPQGAGCE